MADVSFIYRLDDEDQVYFGKYCTQYLSDDYPIDREIYHCTKEVINIHRKKHGEPEIFKLYVGVIGIIKDKYWCSLNEHSAFDLYIDLVKNGKLQPKQNVFYYKGNEYIYYDQEYKDSDDDDDCVSEEDDSDIPYNRNAFAKKGEQGEQEKMGEVGEEMKKGEEGDRNGESKSKQYTNLFPNVPSLKNLFLRGSFS